jgi:glycolate oxidase iron-sulfur subunit
MQTKFAPELLADPAMASSEAVIRKCVHCGFCTATCPTYVLLGDERESPRGRIYSMKDMLENDRTPTAEVVKHIDRCLSCLSCMTTCPSGVNYMHLVDHARSYIEERYRRPWHARLLRAVLATVLPYPGRLRIALALARIARPAAPLLARTKALKPIAAMLALAPARIARRSAAVSSPAVSSRGRVLLLQGCAEPVLRPEIRDASIRVLNRAGYDVVFARGEGCCGALVHHLGKEAASLEAARRNIDAWMREIDAAGLDAIVVSASGCGTTLKDYGFMLRNDPAYAENAAKVSDLAKDVSEILLEAGLTYEQRPWPTVAYQAPCSLQHGQKVDAPRRLLAAAGFAVMTPAEAHLCCGSAGTYNILQPEIAENLGKRKVENLERLRADVIATSNIGCMTQISPLCDTPVVHIVELLDWATGGPQPTSIR